MVLGGDGNPIVAWADTLTQTGHVASGTGGAWMNAPDLPVPTSEPALALDATHGPMLVGGGAGQFTVETLMGGNAWQALQPAAVPAQASAQRIAAGQDGLPVLAWFDPQANSVGMARWTGSRWNVPSPLFSPGGASGEPPLLVVDGEGTAWIGWRDASGVFIVRMTNS
jgi:hypothetical protein